MANILYLVHRLPYPPNKGDKVRSYHLLKHLARHHRIFLGTFIDDPEDEVHVATVRTLCADLQVTRLNPRRARVASLNALLAGEPLTLRYYRSAAMSDWVDQLCRANHIDAAVIFSSAMAQYVESFQRLPTLIDFVDVDSAKWTQYAPRHRWPLSWLYRREGRLLLDYERRMAARSTRSFFVTENEAALFCEQAPECRVRVEAMCNGVDADYFAPDPARPSPYLADELPVVFTGAMDYLPNVDAVTWFKQEVLPDILKRWPNARFHIVGRSPTAEVLALAGEQRGGQRNRSRCPPLSPARRRRRRAAAHRARHPEQDPGGHGHGEAGHRLGGVRCCGQRRKRHGIAHRKQPGGVHCRTGPGTRFG